MEDKNSALIPYILYVLSRKPFMCDTIENVLRDVHNELVKENRSADYNDLANSLQRALEVGQDLGIIYQTNEIIRLPFHFRGKGRKPAPKVRPYDEDEDNVSNVSSCTCGYCNENLPTKKRVRTRRGVSGPQDSGRKRRASKSYRSRNRRSRRHSRRRH